MKYGKIVKKVRVSNEKTYNVYCVQLSSKVRYINPLVNGVRIYDVCTKAKNMIDKNLSYDMSNFIFIDNINV